MDRKRITILLSKCLFISICDERLIDLQHQQSLLFLIAALLVCNSLKMFLRANCNNGKCSKILNTTCPLKRPGKTLET